MRAPPRRPRARSTATLSPCAVVAIARTTKTMPSRERLDDARARGRVARGSGSARPAAPPRRGRPGRRTSPTGPSRARAGSCRPRSRGRSPASCRASVDLAGEDADMPEHVREAALRDPVRRGRDVPAAAELGRDDELALPLGLADEQARAGDVDVDEVVVRVPRRASRRPSRGAARHRRPSASPTRAGRGRCARRCACRRRRRRAGTEQPREEVGELLVGRPVGRAGEGAVEVRAARPEPRVGARGVGRGARHDDQLPA